MRIPVSSLCRLSFHLLPSHTKSAWWWLVAQVFSLWPTWAWMGKRTLDKSDDPLGTLALAMLALTLWQIRHQLRTQPALPWLTLGLALTVTATFISGQLPPLLVGLIAMTAIAATLLAFIPSHIAKLPVFGLTILALPLLSSLQFYAGYPLRIITAQTSSWLLSVAYDVQREGSTLFVNGRQVIVDAPCSGVQMAWLGYFTACSIALWTRMDNKHFMLRLPFVGLIILLGNIVRNSILVALQTGEKPLAQWLHEGIGLVMLALVCLSIAALMSQKNSFNASRNISSSQSRHTDSAATLCVPFGRSLFSIGMTIMLLCTIWTSHTALAKPAHTVQNHDTSTFVEWPYQWKGHPLRPLALTHIEQRFAQDFPGAIARMTDGQRTFIFRRVNRPTRMLHPAADCYRSLGYAIHSEQLHTDEDHLLWRCFMATRQTQTLRVCEHIEDNLGESYTDTSAWYWSAIGNASAGPWTTITIAQPAGSP